jgi:hypothetical protein
MLFNFAFEYAIRRVQVNQDGFILNGTHQLLVHADDVNTLGGSIHTIKKNTKALTAANTETGLEVNADKTLHGHVSRSECRTQSQYRLVQGPLKGWNSSNILEQP